MALLRRIYRRLIPAGAKNSLRLHFLFDERDKPPSSIEEFGDGAVLVLAPHMDDEVIGCGGATRRHVLAGGTVTVAFMTDGRSGDPALDGDAAVDAYVTERKRESERAAEVLGTQELVFLDRPDGALERSPELTRELADLFHRVRPGVVYVPTLLDTHEDHWATSLAFLDALEALGSAADGLVVRQYEVWTPLHANAVVDIESVVNDKRRALAMFTSQLPMLDVERFALGLAQYRSIYHGEGKGWAEAFYESSAGGYRALFERQEQDR
jgi:LmbE family N-acetylglucosaminyl deacetylase